MFIQRGIIENGFDLEFAIIKAGHYAQKKKQLSENDSSQHRVEYNQFHIEYIQHVRPFYARSYNLVEMCQYVYCFLITATFIEG